MDTTEGRNEPLRVLQLEDSADDAALALAQLRRGGLDVTVRCVDSRADFIEALERFRPDVVLADFKLPAFDGRSALDLVRQLHPEIPVIVVSGFLGDEGAVELIKAGARDFVLKDRLARLPSAVRRALDQTRERRLRGEAERKLREREAWFRVVFESAPVPKVIASSTGHIQQVNAAFTALLGYAAEDVWGRSIDDITHPGDRVLTHSSSLAVGNGDADRLQYEKRYLRKDGSEVWALTTITAVEINGERFVVGQIIDLTRLKQAAAENVAIHERLRTAMEGAGAGSWETDLGAGAMVWDPVLRQQYGLREEEPTPDVGTWLGLVHADDRPRLAAALKRPVGEGIDRFEQEFRVPMRDGTLRWFRASGRVTHDAHGVAIRSNGINLDITEHKEAQLDRERTHAELRESERRLSSLMDHLPGIVYRCRNDRDWTTEFISAGCRDLTGYDPASFAPGGALSYADIMLPEDRAPVWETVQAALRERRGFEARYRIRTAQGAIKWLWEKGSGVYGPVGALVALEGFAIDITAQVEAEATQRRLAEIVSSSQDAIISASLDLRITSWNAAAEAIFGYTAAEAIGLPVATFIARERRTFIAERLAVLKAGSTLRNVETVCVRKDGAPVEVEVSLAPGRDERGAVAWLSAIVRDITARKAAERLLQRKEAELREAQRVGRIGSWELDPATGEVKWSAEVYRIFGRDPVRPAPNIHEQILTEESDQRLRAAIGRSLQTGTPYAEDVCFMHAQLGLRWISACGEARRAASGKIDALRGTVQDITERKLQDQALVRVNRALKALSHCNAALIHATDEKHLYEQMTEVVVRDAAYRSACVALVTPEGLSCAAGAGDGVAVLDQAGLGCAVIGSGLGPQCVSSGQVRVARDIGADPALAHWHAQARAAGVRSAVMLPLKDRGGVFGVLGIYSAEPDAFATDEMALLTEMAADLSFGVVTLRARAAHEHSVARLERSMEATVRALAGTVELRDPYTAGHQTRVADLAVGIGRELGLSEERLRGLHLAATIHDVGKLCIPAEILSKPSRLTPIEYEMMKSHPGAGAKILEGIEFPWPIRDMVWQHHERMDGSGYPQGLKGEQILLESRILAVADVLEAIGSHRPYRPTLGAKAALEEIVNGRGTLFDAQVVDACVKLHGTGAGLGIGEAA